MMYRFFITILVLLSFFILPWWCTVLLCIASSIFFDYKEMIVFGFLYDVLYNTKETFLAGHIFFIGALCLYGMMIIVRPYIKTEYVS